VPAITTQFTAIYKTIVGVHLTSNTPPPPPYGAKPTLARVKQAVNRGEPLLPKVFRDGYAVPLSTHLSSLVARMLRAQDAITLETMTGAVYQHNQTMGQAQLRRFLAVISDLYQSFLDKNKRSNANVPIRETLPPLAMFQYEAQNGPFTIPCDGVENEIGANIGVVSLPASYRDTLFLWTALAHETGGHDVVHADPDLLGELATAARDLFGTAAPDMGLLWSYWMDEAAADVYGILNMGPSFGVSLAAFFSALLAQLPGYTGPKPGLRTQSGSDDFGRLDEHPTDILRLHLAIGAIESQNGLSATRIEQYRNQLLALSEFLCPVGVTSVDLQGAIQLDSADSQTIDKSFSLAEMQDNARRIGAMIATQRLNALNAHGIQEIETWDDDDEDKALQVAAGIEDSSKISLRGIGDDAQLLAGLTLALLNDPTLYARGTKLVADALDESFQNDAYWGSPEPDHAMRLSAKAIHVKAPATDIDPLAQELIEYDSREDPQRAFVLGTPDPIPWPRGKAPKAPKPPAPKDGAKLPKCDFVVVTWTKDEANSMARLFTPGIDASPSSGVANRPAWFHYTSNYAALAKLVSSRRAPSLSGHMLGRYYPIQIGSKKVLCFKSEMHLATDGFYLEGGKRMPPLKKLFQQVIEETGAKLVITTGTAGAIGAHLKLGDVVVANECLFHCGRTFKDAPFDGKTFSSKFEMPATAFQLANAKLLAANAGHLRPQRNGVPRVYWSQDQLGQPEVIVTTDFFAFDNVQNTYGLQGLGSAVEMDDAVLGLACSELPKPPQWVAIRNASDPQMDGTTIAAEKASAASIYKQFGFWTTVSSVIASWAVLE
jgi:nucleoside phosphorylase